METERRRGISKRLPHFNSAYVLTYSPIPIAKAQLELCHYVKTDPRWNSRILIREEILQWLRIRHR